jgi:hypothetical protein
MQNRLVGHPAMTEARRLTHSLPTFTFLTWATVGLIVIAAWQESNSASQSAEAAE